MCKYVRTCVAHYPAHPGGEIKSSGAIYGGGLKVSLARTHMVAMSLLAAK